jgi:hypothetical protein
MRIAPFFVVWILDLDRFHFSGFQQVVAAATAATAAVMMMVV